MRGGCSGRDTSIKCACRWSETDFRSALTAVWDVWWPFSVPWNSFMAPAVKKIANTVSWLASMARQWNAVRGWIVFWIFPLYSTVPRVEVLWVYQ